LQAADLAEVQFLLAQGSFQQARLGALVGTYVSPQLRHRLARQSP
jgi:hypothetical protein